MHAEILFTFEVGVNKNQPLSTLYISALLADRVYCLHFVIWLLGYLETIRIVEFLCRENVLELGNHFVVGKMEANYI